MGRALIGIVLAGGLAGSAAAAAADAPAFPKTLEGEALMSWLKRETDITPGQVVALSPSAVTAVISTYPTAEPQGARVIVRAEAVSAEAQAREGVLSWHVSVATDCGQHKVRLGETTGYPQRNLLGAGRAIRPPEPDWRTPQASTPLDSIWRVACDRSFRRPFQGEEAPATAKVAQAAPKPAAPKPAAPQPAAPAQKVAATAPKPTRAKPAAPKPVAARPAEPRPVLAKPAEAAAKPPPGRPGAVVQISASDSEAAAHADIARVFEKLGGRGTRVEKATVNGRTVYRAVVTDFGALPEAVKFCETLKVAGQGCFARAK